MATKIISGDMKITPVFFDPVKFIGTGWKLIPEEHDARNDDLTEIDFSKVDLLHCLNSNESIITGEEKLRRVKALNRIRYGANAFMGTWLDYEARKENSILEMLYLTKGSTYVDFPGDVLLGPDRRRGVLYLYRHNNDGEWNCAPDWLGDGWCDTSLSAVSQELRAQNPFRASY